MTGKIKATLFLIAFGLLIFLAQKFSISSVIVNAQQCRGDLASSRICNKQVGADGKIHVTYSFQDSNGNVINNPSQEVQNSVQGAVNQWNGFSATTGIVFEPASSGTLGDVSFRPNSNIDVGPCAGLHAPSDYVIYNPVFNRLHLKTAR